jgi:hypothetical protein
MVSFHSYSIEGLPVNDCPTPVRWLTINNGARAHCTGGSARGPKSNEKQRKKSRKDTTQAFKKKKEKKRKHSGGVVPQGGGAITRIGRRPAAGTLVRRHEWSAVGADPAYLGLTAPWRPWPRWLLPSEACQSHPSGMGLSLTTRIVAC